MNSFVSLFDGQFTARDWMQQPLHTELITLSACRTGFSIIRHGDEFVGLSRALLSTGTASILLPLWTVSANSTMQWMSDFYSQAWDSSGRKLQTKAEAFQQATFKLREKYSDPYYWAPFVLIGDAF